MQMRGTAQPKAKAKPKIKHKRDKASSSRRATTKISSKGQIVIPREAREALQWRHGDTLIVEIHGDADGVLLRRESPLAQLGPPLGADEVSGMLAGKLKGKPMTPDEMTEKALEAFVRQWKRTGG